MKLPALLLAALTLTGCASGCREACVFGFGPGNSAFDALANYNDRTDPCQTKGKEQGYTLPNYCGSGGRHISVTTGGQTKNYTINRY